ncbi:MAG TPA: PIN domain protein [Candidatus Kapabacteria bacterium]|nr:PIN domain protein [Candidatus Kapabacteria bacterium]
MNKQLKLYIDTSVIGGYYDKEFAHDTQILFNSIISGEYLIVISSVTDDELLTAPLQVKKLLNSVPENLKIKVELTEEAVLLADSYIYENVVGKTSRNDCFHIALATINNVDVLVSWNFKHLVNVLKIRGYNAVNIKNGYKPIDIRSPKELINYEKY